MFGFIKKIFNGLRPNEYTQGLHYYPFAVKLDRCVGGCNTLNDLTGINESKTLTKHVSCECKCKFDCRKCNSNQKWNNGKCRCESKKHHMCEKDYIWNRATCSGENGKYLAGIIDDSVITCDEI